MIPLLAALQATAIEPLPEPIGRLRRDVVDPTGDLDSRKTWHHPIYAHEPRPDPPTATKGSVPPHPLSYYGVCPHTDGPLSRGLSLF